MENSNEIKDIRKKLNAPQALDSMLESIPIIQDYINALESRVIELERILWEELYQDDPLDND